MWMTGLLMSQAGSQGPRGSRPRLTLFPGTGIDPAWRCRLPWLGCGRSSPRVPRPASSCRARQPVDGAARCGPRQGGAADGHGSPTSTVSLWQSMAVASCAQPEPRGCVSVPAAWSKAVSRGSRGPAAVLRGPRPELAAQAGLSGTHPALALHRRGLPDWSPWSRQGRHPKPVLAGIPLTAEHRLVCGLSPRESSFHRRLLAAFLRRHSWHITGFTTGPRALSAPVM